MFSDDQPICEATASDFTRSPATYVKRAEDGERVVVTRNGTPVAVMVGLSDALEALIAGSQRFALMRREAREQLADGLTLELPEWRSRSG